MQTKVIYNQNTVEVYIGIERIALHKRKLRPNDYTTQPDHMPDAHSFYAKSQE